MEERVFGANSVQTATVGYICNCYVYISITSLWDSFVAVVYVCIFAADNPKKVNRMKTRIVQIMEHEGLTPAKFAEIINIRRASISHITTGRNQPSLQVAAKILDKYPNISPDWLLFGKGNMLRTPAASVAEPDLFPPAPVTAPVTTSITLQPGPAGDAAQPAYPPSEPAKAPKRVSKIVVFYSDNTYDTFIVEQPERAKD